MSNHLFSVIVPAHNAENHIRRLLDSISSQTFRDYELIVVCDKCTDSTEKIAKEYGARTFAVDFHSDGKSRDYGVSMAEGKYILFADDDDWYMHEYCFQQIADSIYGAEPDMVAFGYIFRTKGYKAPEGDELFTPRIAHVWSKAWKHSVIGDAVFGDAVFCSDTYFLKAMRTRIQSCTTVNMPLYYYNFLRPGSQTDLFVHGIIRQSPVAE